MHGTSQGFRFRRHDGSVFFAGLGSACCEITQTYFCSPDPSAFISKSFNGWLFSQVQGFSSSEIFVFQFSAALGLFLGGMRREGKGRQGKRRESRKDGDEGGKRERERKGEGEGEGEGEGQGRLEESASDIEELLDIR